MTGRNAGGMVRGVWTCAVLALAIALSAATATAAHAPPAPSRATCTLEFAWTLRVPTSMTPTRGRFRSTTGTFSCRGTVFGRTAVDRPGRLVASERYGPDSCLSGHGDGPFAAVLRTTRGPLHVHGHFYERRAVATGATTGWLSPRRGGVARFRGSYALVPKGGQSCFTKPVRSGTVKATVVLTG